MITWQATIKERGNDRLLTPTYSFADYDNLFGHIASERQKECEIKKFLIKFWGLQNQDVEWFSLEKL